MSNVERSSHPSAAHSWKVEHQTVEIPRWRFLLWWATTFASHCRSFKALMRSCGREPARLPSRHGCIGVSSPSTECLAVSWGSRFSIIAAAEQSISANDIVWTWNLYHCDTCQTTDGTHLYFRLIPVGPLA
jgi:hypothetical protein